MLVHLVFTTQYRRPAFKATLLDDIETLFTEQLGAMDCELIEFGGESDHVHLLIQMPPTLAI